MSPNREADHWDKYYGELGHTGYAERSLYRYDQRLRIRAFRRAVNKLGDGSKSVDALDIGCGTGDVIALLRERNNNVVAIDISPAVVRDTAHQFAGDDAVTVSASAVHELPFPSSSVDLVTSVTVLQHITSDETLRASLLTLRKTLRPGGHMVALEIAPSRPTGYVSTGVTERDDTAWRSAFAEAGYSILSVSNYAPWGPLALHLFDRLIGRLVGNVGLSAAGTASNDGDMRVAPVAKRGVMRRLFSNSFQLIRQIVLWSAWPVDHIFHVPAPGRMAYYRIYTLRLDCK